jgi:cytochrome c oxidase assembly factor CtaG
VLNDTGDQDLCYFNFLCAHPLGDLTDFNHVYSNLGYVLLGLLFIINTARRDVRRRQAQANHDRLEKVKILICFHLFFFFALFFMSVLYRFYYLIVLRNSSTLRPLLRYGNSINGTHIFPWFIFSVNY